VDKQYSQLIQTKICIPRLRSRIIDRERLIKKGTAEPGVVLSLVSAPAGYGKTTLMVELSRALAKSGKVIAWYTLDSSDNDPNLFISYLVESLGGALQIKTDLVNVTRLLRSSTEMNMEKILPVIINAAASKDQNCWLFLDDYHLITSPAVHSGLAYLLDHLPENINVVIGSRSDPPLPLARLRARGQLTEIRAGDLRFRQDETVQFLNNTMGLALTSETVNEMQASTEGWITGLQLAALSVTSQGDSGGFSSHFGADNRYIVEYLLQEVIERQPEEVQHFLLSTSVLERFCGPLGDAVFSGQSGSEVILDRLEQANLFIIPLDNEGYWYRYHHLFRDFLRTRLKKSDPDLVPLLHQAASEWYSSQQLLGEAVSHSLETQNWDYAASVVEKHGMTMFNHSELAILRRWCENFPEEIFQSRPMLCILHGWALSLSYRKENRRLVEERMQQAEDTANALEDEQLGLQLVSQAALVRLSLCLIPDPFIDPEEVIAFAQKTSELFLQDSSGRAIATSAIGYAYQALQDVPLSIKKMEKFRRLSLAGGFYYGVAAATFYLANLAYYQGQLNYAKQMCQQVKTSIAEVVANPEQELPAIGSLDIAQGCLLLEENRLDEAEQALRYGLALVNETNNPFYRMAACIALFRLCMIRGEETEAFQFLDEIETAWPDIAFYTQGQRLMHQIGTTPEDSQTIQQAEDWCRMFLPYIAEKTFSPGIGPFGGTEAYYMASLIWIQAQIFLGTPENTLSYLERQQNIARAQGLTYRLIELSSAEAQVRKALGEDHHAFDLINQALNIARSSGCLRVFDRGTALTDLLEEAARHGIAREFAGQILRMLKTPNDRSVKQPATLSDRELELLNLMASGASNQEIADRLVITVGTVKSHINHIFDKLDVHNRLEAVARGRETGLIKI